MKRDADTHRIFSRRALLLGGAQAVLMTGLAARMYYLQVIESEQYKLLADENRINLRLLPPPRGRVLDRHGVELANNQQNYRVVLIAEQADSVAQTLDSLAELIPIDRYERAKVLREVKRRRSFVPVTVAENLTWEEFARVNVNAPDLPGIQPEIGETRAYPHGPTMAHVIGYVGAVSEKDLTGDPLLELPGFRVGKSGVERTREEYLRGKAGVSRVEVNAFGRVIRELNRREGQPGEDLKLSLDAELQIYMMKLLADESASAVVMDIHSGNVLGLASTPGFDPQSFNIGLTQQAWSDLTSDPRNPLLNKAIAGQYPPGSIFKMMVAIAALEAGVVSPEQKIFCSGHVELGNQRFHCWKRNGHGNMALVDAIEQSCDVYFYDIAKRVGIDRISETARLFGLGAETGIEIPAERKGLMPTRAWKKGRTGEAWQQGETLVAGIGQGFVLTTPLQLAVMAARIANGGFAVKPRLILDTQEDGVPPVELERLPIGRASLQLVAEGMRRVSNVPTGTAFRARINDSAMALAGKTGTSQVRRITRAERETGVLRNDQLPWAERDHALFVAFAPTVAPRYAVSVVVEHGGSGSGTAAPIARDILIKIQEIERAGRGPQVGGNTSLLEDRG
ncbi:MAG: penicillin-binding protein 2 [Proteobacteria bacterium]|nr:penicillin-binding protein 2 [Pseudomonadota bacterium]MDA1059092.1 penicillin-binding protein 2 [Pseudomonadota bacterium]